MNQGTNNGTLPANHLEYRLKAIIETAIDGIITIDENGIIESVNPAAAQLFGYASQEMIGANIHMLMPEPDRSQHDGYIRRYQQTGEKHIIGIGREVLGQKRDGTIFPIRLAISEVILPSGTKLFTGIIHDLSELKTAEKTLNQYAQELERKNKRISQLNANLEKRVEARTDALGMAIQQLEVANHALAQRISEKTEIEQALLEREEELRLALTKEKELNELKSRFVSMASHEFRTPLSTILSSITLLEKYEGTNHLEKKAKHLQRVRSAVHNLTVILNDFLSLEKLEKGLISSKPEVIDVTQFMEKIIEDIEPELKPGQTLAYRHLEGRQRVSLDPQLLTNIIINLVSNAIKYSGESKPILIETQEKNNCFHLSVSDKGIGIPEHEQDQIFERFYRAKNATNIQGTGLGLNIIKKYCDIMGGRVDFTSALDEGSTFSIRFPQPQAP